jgi:glutamate synthase (NADPH/NADH) small chain
LVLLALGFTGPEKTLSEQLGLEIDFRNNYKASNYQTNKPNIFTAGDMRRGQSLIVWAISEGREAARAVVIYLMGKSNLPTKVNGDLPCL